MAAVGDPLALEAPRRLVVQRGVVVVHLGVLVLGIELDDRRLDLAAVVHLVGRVEILPEDVLRGVGLPGAGAARDERVPEDEWVAVAVVVLQPVVDRRGVGGGPDPLAADREVPEEDAVGGDLEPGLDLVAVGRLRDHGAGSSEATNL